MLNSANFLDIGCPFMNVMPQANPLVYHISTDGSMNVTGRCGAIEVTLYNCDIDGEWKEQNTCQNKSTVSQTTTSTTIKPNTINYLLVAILLPSVMAAACIFMIVFVILVLCKL